MHLISVYFVETSFCTNIKHLKLSALRYERLKSSQGLFTTDAKVVKSSSFLVRLRHFHLLWKREVFGLKSFICNSTTSVNINSQVFRAKWNLRILCAQLFYVYSEDEFSSSHSNFHNLFCINLLNISTKIWRKNYVFLGRVWKILDRIPNGVLRKRKFVFYRISTTCQFQSLFLTFEPFLFHSSWIFSCFCSVFFWYSHCFSSRFSWFSFWVWISNTMSCFSSGPQLRHILNAAVGTKEWGQDFARNFVRNARTLQTVTWTLLVPMNSTWSRKNLSRYCSSVGSKASHIAKLRLQKYWYGMPAVRRSSSNVSFFTPVSLLVLRSVTTRDRIRGSRALEISGIGKMTLHWKYWIYLPTLLSHNLPDPFAGFSRRLVLLKNLGYFLSVSVQKV